MKKNLRNLLSFFLVTALGGAMTATAQTEVNSIAEFTALGNGAEAILNLTDAHVTYVNGVNIYVRDATGGMNFYNQPTMAEADNQTILNGKVKGKVSIYRGMTEMNVSDVSELKMTRASEPYQPVEISVADAADHIADLVRIKDVTVHQIDGKWYTDEDKTLQIYDQFRLSYTLNDGSSYSTIVGVIIPYNSQLEILPTETPELFIPEVPVEVNNIAEFIALEKNSYVKLNLVDARVTFASSDKKEIYLRDATGGIRLFDQKMAKSLTNQSVLNGSIYGYVRKVWSDCMPQMDITDTKDMVVTSASDYYQPVGINAEEAEEHLCDYVTLGEVTIHEYDGNLYADTDKKLMLYNEFGLEYSLSDGDIVKDLTGVIINYDHQWEIYPTEIPIVLQPEIVYQETFTVKRGYFTVEDKVMPEEGLDYVWHRDGIFGMVATATADGESYSAESWLVSPVIDLADAKKTSVSFTHTTNFFANTETAKSRLSVMIKVDDGEWTKMEGVSFPTSQNWTWVDNEIDLSAYDGHQIQIAFRYTSMLQAGTWEVRNFEVSAIGKVDILANDDVDPVVHEVDSFAAFNELNDGAEVVLTLHDAHVTYVHGLDVYAWDGSGGIYFRKQEGLAGATNKTILSGVLKGSVNIYGNTKQMVVADASGLVMAEGEEEYKPVEISLSEVVSNVYNLVTIKEDLTMSNNGFVDSALRIYIRNAFGLEYDLQEGYVVKGITGVVNYYGTRYEILPTLVPEIDMSTVGIRQVEDEKGNSSECYSVAGYPLVAPSKGINLLKMRDGNVRKVVVR